MSLMPLAGLLLLATGAVAAPPHSHVLTPLKIQPIPTHFHGFEKFFSKYIPVLSEWDTTNGVQVVATKGVPDEKVERVANVLAQFLDNDADGWLDNPDVVLQMGKHGATMIMFADDDELEASGFDDIPGFDAQDVEGDETGSNRTLRAHLMTSEHVGRQHVCKNRRDLICDAPLEEVFHLVTDEGFAFAYPKQFATTPGSELAISMDQVIGNCGYSSVDNPFGRHTVFRFPNCTGGYHYDDDTCGYGCLATEYFHHFIASYNGEYPWGKPDMCPDSQGPSDEWELCAVTADGKLDRSRELLKRGDPDGFALITDSFYKVPLKMPDGNYTPRYVPPDSDLRAPHQRAVADMPLAAFGKIVLEGRARRAHRSRLAGKVMTSHVLV